MCTSITLHQPRCYFGRNLDLDYSFGEQVVITPRLFPLPFHRLPLLSHHFSMIGMANVTDGYPLYAEAVNEKGLYMAGLHFPGNAYYETEISDTFYAVTPWELIPWILGTCENLSQAKNKLSHFRPLAIPFSYSHPSPGTLPLSPLHWHLADSTGALVLEATKDGIFLYEDAAGVLTNNPSFLFHQTHLNCYQNLSPDPVQNHFAPDLSLKAFSQGLGALGLPGDNSSVSRYVRAAFHKLNSISGHSESEQISQFFHLLDTVSMVRGSVITENGHPDFTRYSCCISPHEGIYYFKTYENSRIRAVRFREKDPDTKELFRFPLHPDQDILYLN